MQVNIHKFGDTDCVGPPANSPPGCILAVNFTPFLLPHFFIQMLLQIISVSRWGSFVLSFTEMIQTIFSSAFNGGKIQFVLPTVKMAGFFFTKIP